MKIHLVLYKGCWERRPATEARLRERLQRFFGGNFGGVRFTPPDDSDVALDAEAIVYPDEEAVDLLCDRLTEHLLQYMEPEFTSMLEVEAIDV